MKQLILVTCVTLFSFLAYAQKPAPLSSTDDAQPNFAIPMKNTWLDRFEKRQIKMIQLIGLSAEQKRSLDTLNDHYVTQRAALQEDKTIDLRTRSHKTELLRRERESKFKSYLTDKQLQKWNELRKAQKKKTFRKK